jgi:hypothetical protein
MTFNQMVRNIYILILFLIFISCSQNYTAEYLEISNSELKSQIIEYVNHTDSLLVKTPYSIDVCCMNVNDSTTRYVISSNIDSKTLRMFPYHFICKVNGRDIYFVMLAGIVKKDWGKRNFFNLKTTTKIEYMRKNFPEEYRKYKNKIDDGVFILYEPEMCYLTFIEDKLVKKEMRRGLPWW